MSERIDALLDAARRALRQARRLSPVDRRRGLRAIAEAIEGRADAILAANAEDVEASPDLSSALRDRLRLTPARIEGMARAVRNVAEQPDPLEEERDLGVGPSGIAVRKKRVPLGVVAVIYEARPNVTAECSALTLASGNAIILRGGKEACRSNEAIGEAVRAGLLQAELPPDLVTVLARSSREEVQALLGAVGRVDLVIPRGGDGLMSMVDQHARVPVIRHGQGICHVYVDAAADPQMAADIALNAKVHRPGVCNSIETLLIHEELLASTLARLGPALTNAGVEIRADPSAKAVLQQNGVSAQPATDADWDTEFLSLVLAIRTVANFEQAVEHIDRHGTNHTAAIVSGDEAAAERFLTEVDASCVLWNASTRFNDGGELGLGAEMGISTTRMHAYGPMSAREMTAEKIVVRGRGQVRA
ncbi:MAG: glutamate-5-semialdehyde dehydrogenase [Myxococcota bacterium]